MNSGDYVALAAHGNHDYQMFNETLKKILVPRVPGTQSHATVRDVSLLFFSKS